MCNFNLLPKLPPHQSLYSTQSEKNTSEKSTTQLLLDSQGWRGRELLNCNQLFTGLKFSVRKEHKSTTNTTKTTKPAYSQIRRFYGKFLVENNIKDSHVSEKLCKLYEVYSYLLTLSNMISSFLDLCLYLLKSILFHSREAFCYYLLKIEKTIL